MITLSDQDLAALRKWMHEELGLHGDDYRPTFLARRIGPRLSAAGCTDVGTYLAFLRKNPAEAKAFASKFFVPTSEFFRNAEVFQSLRRLLPERAHLLGWPALKMVSAACSTGEEPVSLAILLEEVALDGRVLALDRSLAALHALRQGLFTRRALEKVDLKLKERYFREDGEKARVVQRVAARICPICCDLGEGLPVRGAHVVVMRNLFIYLTEASQVRLLDGSARALVPGGLLVLGRVEAPSPLRAAAWKPVDRAARIYERTGRDE